MNDAIMKSWMESATPGPHHKALEAMAGKFKYTNKWKMDPSQDWTVTEGDYDGQMMMGGRYLMVTVKGPMMGSEFEGMGCLGYDNTIQKHVAGWIDNMGTGIMRSEGTCDNDCNAETRRTRSERGGEGARDCRGVWSWGNQGCPRPADRAYE